MPMQSSFQSHLSHLFILTSSRIKNPLVGIPKAELFDQVETYAKEHSLEDIVPLLKKGALAAQHPESLESIEELDPSELQVLQDEKSRRWHHPRTLYFLIALNSIGAAIQGWDQTGSNGANLSFPQEFGIADSGADCEAAETCLKHSWIIGAINSAPYMAIALFACWLSDPVNHFIGRRLVNDIKRREVLAADHLSGGPSSSAPSSACSLQLVRLLRSHGLRSSSVVSS